MNTAACAAFASWQESYVNSCACFMVCQFHLTGREKVQRMWFDQDRDTGCKNMCQCAQRQVLHHDLLDIMYVFDLCSSNEDFDLCIDLNTNSLCMNRSESEFENKRHLRNRILQRNF